ncbi:TraB/GumN family protein [Consotaella salsifontis]|uniref:Polysaccharide biosynthesis protein GumN n=1 Tax=Consotaella salsifontis TaxID=1365950 RepID=A0A1T4T538_9HYPH|nr:TraB/GumN family protein [Consotaella salsifontis]SKA35640.1 hypothetical protein SAMN05428963_11978 [Consotaella salsifontis]
MSPTQLPIRRPCPLDRLTDAALAVAALLPLALVLALAWVGLARAEESPNVTPTVCPGENLLPSFDAAQRARLDEAMKTTPHGEGRLFEVTKPGLSPSYLFGTMHLTDPRVLELPAPVETAFNRASRLVIESTDILDEAKASAAILTRPDLMTLPAGKTLDDFLKPDQREDLEKNLADHGVPYGSIRTLQPWFASVSLLLPACETARKAAGIAVLDVDLARRAKAAGKPVDGLETAIEQLEAMASLPMDVQVESLLASTALAERMPDITATMIALYLDGRIGAIGPLTEMVSPSAETGGIDAGEAYAEFEEKLVTTRNRTMAKRLKPLLEKGGTFVAVGALHLPGEEGLVELLARDGWTVKRAD